MVARWGCCGLVEAAEPGVGRAVRHDAVHQDRIDVETEEPQVGPDPPGLRHHHRLGRGHEPDRGDPRVRERVVESPELVGQLEHAVEDARGRRGHRRGPTQDGRHRAGEAPMSGEHTVEVCPQRRGEGQETNGLGGRGAVDDHRIPLAQRVLGDGAQREQLVEARDHRQFLGADAVGARPFEQVLQVGPHRRPGAVEQLLRIDLLGAERRRDRCRIAPDRAPERIAEGVRSVRGHHQGSCTAVGGQQRGGRGHRRLAGPTLAGDEQDPRLRGRRAPAKRLPGRPQRPACRPLVHRPSRLPRDCVSL